MLMLKELLLALTLSALLAGFAHAQEEEPAEAGSGTTAKLVLPKVGEPEADRAIAAA